MPQIILYETIIIFLIDPLTKLIILTVIRSRYGRFKREVQYPRALLRNDVRSHGRLTK